MFRKTNPRVRDGRVQPKNRRTRSDARDQQLLSWPEIGRERAGRTWRHVVSKEDLQSFVALIPDWLEVSDGLRAIVLDRGSTAFLGCYDAGVIRLTAWDRDLVVCWERAFHEEHAEVLEMIGVPTEADGDEVLCRFDERSARAFMLLHVLLHELGHHRDRMRTRHRRDCPGGEPFAEAWALERGRAMWPRYARVFDRR
jgi:hypothetical protein